jgi:hypothetical protein
MRAKWTSRPGLGSIVVVAMTLALTACSPTAIPPSVSAAPAATAAPTSSAAVPSQAPSEVATSSPAPSAPLVVKKLCFSGASSCKLSAGRYTTAPSSAAFDLTVADGWSNDLLDPAGGEVTIATASIFWVVDPHGGDHVAQEIKIAKTTAAVVKYLQGLKGTSSTAPVDTTIGGAAATQIDVTSSARNNFVLLAGHVGFGLHATTKARFIVVQRPDLVVTIIVSTDDPKQFDAVLNAVEPILASITWE